jgi:VWFA-related protein
LPLSRLPDGQSKISVHSDEVVVPVTALDKQGGLVLDLTQKDFHVFDNGVEQEITRWDFGGDPVVVTLIIETSAHIQMMAPVIRKMASIFTENVMALDGEAAVITYDTTVDIRQPFTQDHDAIEKVIGNLEFETPNLKLYDAMATAVQLLISLRSTRRRIILIVGESQDYSSQAELSKVLRDAALNNITIYAVGPSSTTADLRYGTRGQNGGNLPPLLLPKAIPPVSTTDPPRDPQGQPLFDFGTPLFWLLERGTNEIKNLRLEHAVLATGGVHYGALRDKTILTALDKIGGELHAQYTLSYMPNGERTPGFHKIQVSVARSGVTVRTRPGYFPGLATDPAVVPARCK